MTEVRTLPIRLPPVAGEALDSWLEAMAHRLDTHLEDLLLAVGLGERDAGIGGSGRSPITLRPGELAAVAAATGVPAAQVDAMTLARYDGTALRLDSRTNRVSRHHLWGRARGSRFCPDCLAESGGRWSLVWRLGWCFACLRHRRLLADACPQCGRAQRQRPHPVHVIPDPGHCAGPTAGGSGLAAQRCGADLALARTTRLPEDHPVLIAQRHLLDTIDSGTATFGVYRGHPQPAAAALNDVRALANRALNHATGDQFAAVIPADRHTTSNPAATSAISVQPSDPQHRPGFMAPGRAVTAAVGITAAVTVLACDTIDQAGEALRWLVNGSRQRGTTVSTTTIHAWGRGISPTLTAVQLRALDPLLNPSDRLRYRSTTATPRPPDRSTQAAEHRARHTPTMFWPAWSLRLALPACHQPHLRPALSCAVQLIGTRLRLSQSASALTSPMAGHGLSRILQLLAAHRCWPHIYTALIRLADYLDTHHIPIDYQRRRTLRYDDLLPEDEWSQLCRRTGTVAGTRKVTIVRSVLFEQISGLPADRGPFADDNRDFRAKVAAFPADLTPNLAAGLHHAAQTFLHRHGIHDEPVTWQPPLELLSDLDLPGPNPDSIDTQQLHRLIRQDGSTLSRCAEQLDTTIDVVRYLLDRQPAPPTLQPGTLARTALFKHDLVDLYHRQHLTLREIGNRIGVSRQTITQLAREYGIQLRPAPLPRTIVDRDWLYEQYVMHRRTLPDLARETGMSTANMARWAKTHHIPLRPRGGGSHNQVRVTLDQANSAPRILRPALTGHGAWDRLHRFAATAQHPTIGAAATALGLNPSTLVKQINRLERDLGGQLLTRAERGQPMLLTPLGRKVIAAIRKYCSEEMPRH